MSLLHTYRKPLVIVGVVLVGLLYYLFSGSPEQATLNRLSKALQASDVNATLACFHPQFSAFFAEDLGALKLFIRNGLQTSRKVNLNVSKLEILERGSAQSRTKMHYTILSNYNGQPVFVQGSFNRKEQLDVLFRKQGGEWLISGFEYTGEELRRKLEIEQIARALRERRM